VARHKHRPSGRTTPKGTRPAERPRHPDRDAPPFVADAAACLGERSPFSLVSMASALVEVTSPRPLDAWPGAQRKERPDAASLFLSFAQTEHPAMGALALAAAALVPDELLASRVRKAVDPQALLQGPAWLGSIGSIEITGTAVQTDPFGDGDNVLVSWRWADGSPGTAVIYIDHNMGTLVKDAFVIPENGDRVAAKYASFGEQHLSRAAIDPADARARVLAAIEQGDHTVPPVETDTWPMCRPVVEWLLRHLPVGGVGYVRPEWSSAQRDRLLDDFVASPFAQVSGLSAMQVRELADPLVWFGCDAGRPVAVESGVGGDRARRLVPAQGVRPGGSRASSGARRARRFGPLRPRHQGDPGRPDRGDARRDRVLARAFPRGDARTGAVAAVERGVVGGGCRGARPGRLRRW
jgi:hypothetical protein